MYLQFAFVSVSVSLLFVCILCICKHVQLETSTSASISISISTSISISMFIAPHRIVFRDPRMAQRFSCRVPLSLPGDSSFRKDSYARALA